MSDMTTPGHLSWSELMTSNPSAAAEFYGSLFGWTFSLMDMPDGTYHVASNGDDKIAGIMQLPSDSPSQNASWGQYVTVDDIHATAAKIQRLGGNLLVPPTTIPGVGEFILFTDPQGAALSAIQYANEGE